MLGWPNISILAKLRPPSLKNIGATCYLNSAFQGISACDTFVKEIDDLCQQYAGERLVHELHVFKDLMDILNGCRTSEMEISRNPIFKNWNKSGQQDSYELLAYAMNQVYNALRKFKEEKREIPTRDLQTWLKESLPMRVRLQYKIECGCTRITESPMQSDLALHITIPLKNKTSKLDALIDLYFGEDPIEDYICDREGCRGKNTKRVARLVRPLPRTICIHLQRSYWDGYSMKKINNNVLFENTIVLKSSYVYCEQRRDDISSPTSAKSKERNEECSSNKSSDQVDFVSSNYDSDKKKWNGTSNEEWQVNSIRKDDQLHGTVQNSERSFAQDSEMECDEGSYDSDRNDQKGNDISDTIRESYNDVRGVNKNGGDNNGAIKENKTPGGISQAEKDEHYNLVSVIVHSGTVFGGHYICYKKVSNRWFLTNDWSVKEVDEKEIKKSQAYILFYEQSL